MKVWILVRVSHLRCEVSDGYVSLRALCLDEGVGYGLAKSGRREWRDGGMVKYLFRVDVRRIEGRGNGEFFKKGKV